MELDELALAEVYCAVMGRSGSIRSTYSLVHQPTGTKVATVKCLKGFWSKGIGLMGRRNIETQSGIWMPGVASIHTLFMAFPVDVLFLDRDYRLRKVVRGLKPWRPLCGRPGAHHTLELAEGSLAVVDNLAIGDVWVIHRDI